MIPLPPKVKCPEPGCQDGRIYTGYASLNAAMTGKVSYRNCPRCNGDGEIYLDRDLIEAITAAELNYEVGNCPSHPELHYALIGRRMYSASNRNWDWEWTQYGSGPNSTAALLAAINAHNLKDEK